MINQLTFKGADCFYKTEGKGNTVMLVHGFIEEGSMWDGIVSALKNKYRFIIPDLPGFGKSQLPNSEPKLSMELYADYLYAICRQEKIKKIILLGHSMGGYATLSFAEKHPEMLSGFGLLNSHCFADTEAKKINRKKGIEFICKHGTKPFVTELYGNLFHDSFKRKNKKLTDSLIDKAILYSPQALMLANEAMMNRKDKSGVLKNAKVPVLIIGGKEDEAAPIELVLKQSSFPSIADIHLFSQCKHMSLFEKKKEVVKIIDTFCK